MKRIIFLILMLTAILYLVETNENIGFSQYKPILSVTYADNQYVLTWSKIPYFAYYEVEVLNKTPEEEHAKIISLHLPDN